MSKKINLVLQNVYYMYNIENLHILYYRFLLEYFDQLCETDTDIL